ncbi:hypothetical protein B0H13DRAFT_1006898 [Mycena leptocephala]|nr:hypothetical protein B0H13DRAFT_1006898 [Mycena leptocephala]
MASPFAPQLGTNYCPTDDEVGEIKAFLIEPTLRLKRLDDEISDLQRAIDKLRAERESLGADVKAHRALISPVRRLPLDIIQEIFIACLPTHRNCVMSASEPQSCSDVYAASGEPSCSPPHDFGLASMSLNPHASS